MAKVESQGTPYCRSSYGDISTLAVTFVPRPYSIWVWQQSRSKSVVLCLTSSIQCFGQEFSLTLMLVKGLICLQTKPVFLCGTA